MAKLVFTSLDILTKYIETENFKGYDPYDTLNSWVHFEGLGKWGPVLATQFQKRNPINIRPLLGIKKEINPKAFGLFLHAYSVLYKKTKNEEYKTKADYFFNWLKNNYSLGYSGYCWGYNFPWAGPGKYADKFTPSSVVTGFICKGIYEYYNIDGSHEAKDILISAADFILNDIPCIEDENGICFSYTPLKEDLCFNSSLFAAEILARAYTFNENEDYKSKAINSVNWVIHHQKSDGRWNYSADIDTGIERQQVDFHQGYVLESIYEIKNLLEIENQAWDNSITKGLGFYRNVQFLDHGVSFWRYPKRWPVEIHNQAQGIITMTKLHHYCPDLVGFPEKIAAWSIDNMQAKDGHFYYQKFPTHTHKISYMRWSNAWMFLALSMIIRDKR